MNRCVATLVTWIHYYYYYRGDFLMEFILDLSSSFHIGFHKGL